MKRSLPISCLVLFLALHSDLSRAQWVQTNKLCGGGANCIVHSGSTLFAGTSNGIYRSTNNGVSWVETDNGLTDRYVYSLAASGSEIFAGTRTGVSRSTDNGDSWMADTAGLPAYDTTYGGYADYMAIAMIGTNVVAMSYENGIFYSTNNGSIWTYAGSQSGTLNTCTVIGSNIFIGGDLGVLRSSDYGKSWTSQNNGFPNSVGVFHLATGGTNLYAAGSDANIYRSTDLGAHWVSIGSPLIDSIRMWEILLSLLSVNNDLFVGTEDHGMYHSTDNGGTWSLIHFPTIEPNMEANLLVLDGSTIIAGTPVDLLLSTDMGTSWTLSDSGFSHTGVTALGFNGPTLFAATNSSGMFRSSDGGNSWDKADTGIMGSNITAFTRIGSTLYIGTFHAGVWDSTNSGVLRSTDNGSTWNGPDSDIQPYIWVNAIAGSGRNLFAGTWFAGGVNGGVFRSTDSGTSWTPAGLQSTAIKSLLVIGNNIIAGSQYDGGIFLSTDNGVSWTNVYPAGTFVYSLGANGSTLFAATYNGVVRSTDSGVTWTTIGLTTTLTQSFLSNGSAIFVGGAIFLSTDSGIFLSTDNGSNWSAVNTGLTDINIVALAVSGQTLYAASADLVWSRPLSQMIGNNAVTPTPPTSFEIKSYPNPFSSQATITFASQTEGYAEVTIVNLLGSQVARLFTGELAAGEHSFVWDMPPGLPDGMYEGVVNVGGHMQRISLVHLR